MHDAIDATHSDDPATLTATLALGRIRAGTLTVEALASACLARVESREPTVHAWAFVDSGIVIEQARELDRRASLGRFGALHGLPIGVKDVMLTRDMPTQYNAEVYRGFHPRLDAACVATLRAAGALIFGKTETVEFAATGRPAPTRNPHDLARTPGGSSSGSAAAVADFHVPLALGTQTGGSMIRPASFCGIYAMKPTWNLVSREGVKTCSISLDTVGWFARSAADLALLHEVFEPEPEPDRRSAPAPFALAGARIGLCRSPAWPAASLDTRHAIERAASLLREAGADVSDLDLPRPFDDLVDLHRIVMRAEGQGAFLAEYCTFGTALTESFREQVENVDRTTRAQLLHAYDTASACRSIFDRIAAPFDAVLTPSTVGVAPEGLAATGAMTFNAMWSLLHVPAINVPGLQGSNGMPVGLTLTGPRFSDRHLLAVAASLGALLARERA